MKISFVVAYDKNRLIGDSKSNDLPWRLPEDLALFKERTLGNVIVMGRKTWESLPKKPLPKRVNLVVTTTVTDSYLQGTTNRTNAPVEELPRAIEDVSLLKSDIFKAYVSEFPPKGDKKVYIIGGAQLYKTALALNVVDEIIATEIQDEFEGDIYFPELDDSWDKGEILSEHDKFNVVRYRKCN